MKLYICGDSFCVDDSDYGDNWINLLTKKYQNLEIVNLASSGASNYLIYLQVKKALNENCDYLIYNATSSIRQEFSINIDNSETDDICRYWNINNQSRKTSMICGSWLGIDRHYKEKLTQEQTTEIHNFFSQFVDLPNLIEKNFIFISHTLKLLESSSTIWAWTQGGFEHKSFSKMTYPEFDKYRSKECDINLWDYYIPNQVRPWFHVTNKKVHQTVCNCYENILKLNYDSN